MFVFHGNRQGGLLFCNMVVLKVKGVLSSKLEFVNLRYYKRLNLFDYG